MRKRDKVDRIIGDAIYEFTHLWVDGFGLENTVLLPSDFDKVLKMPIKDKDGSYLFMGYNFYKQKIEIRKFKGNYYGRN